MATKATKASKAVTAPAPRMRKEDFKDLPIYLAILDGAEKQDVILFRGQSRNLPLLPKITRKDPTVDTTTVEQEMLAELRRRGDIFLNGHTPADDWDLLVQAQHFGMATRLLDWSSNPLVALWFSCIFAKKGEDSYVYVFHVKDQYLLDRTTDPDPFKRTKTRVFKPKLNNPRIVAQSGWFTAHKHSKTAGKFVALDVNPDVRADIIELRVPEKLREELLIQLNFLGVSYQTMFPDMEGLCKYINWMYE